MPVAQAFQGHVGPEPCEPVQEISATSFGLGRERKVVEGIIGKEVVQLQAVNVHPCFVGRPCGIEGGVHPCRAFSFAQLEVGGVALPLETGGAIDAHVRNGDVLHGFSSGQCFHEIEVACLQVEPDVCTHVDGVGQMSQFAVGFQGESIGQPGFQGVEGDFVHVAVGCDAQHDRRIRVSPDKGRGETACEKQDVLFAQFAHDAGGEIPFRLCRDGGKVHVGLCPQVRIRGA